MKSKLLTAKNGALIAAMSAAIMLTATPKAAAEECAVQVRAADGTITLTPTECIAPLQFGNTGNLQNQQGFKQFEAPDYKVIQDTDVYDAPGGKRIGDEDFFLQAGKTVPVFGECGDDWCQVYVSTEDYSGGAWAWGGHLEAVDNF